MIASETAFRPATAPERHGALMHPVLIPVIAGAVAAFAVDHWHLAPAYKDSDLVSFAGAVASVGATMLGFILAALAVVASISHTHLVQQMQKTGHYSDLLNTMGGCGLLFLLCALGGLAMLFGVPAGGVAMAVLIGMHVAAWLSLLDVARKFTLVLSNLRPGA